MNIHLHIKPMWGVIFLFLKHIILAENVEKLKLLSITQIITLYIRVFEEY